MSLDFVAAYAGGSVAQAALVAGAATVTLPVLPRSLRVRHGLFALLPLLSLVGVVAGLRLWPDHADAIAKLALVAVPALALLAALRIGPLAFAVTLAMVALVLADAHSLAGQLSALGLIAASATPHWLGIGIIAMAIVDLVLVASGLLGPAARALNDAAVGEGLPQLQRVELGALTMGYGDVFLPALVGALLAARARPRAWVAGLTLGLALLAGGVFLIFDTLPATVPVALALLIVEGGRGLFRAHRQARERRTGAAPAAVGPPAG